MKLKIKLSDILKVLAAINDLMEKAATVAVGGTIDHSFTVKTNGQKFEVKIELSQKL